MNFKKWGAIQRWRIQLGYSTIGVFGIGIVIAKSLQDLLHNAGFDVPFIPLYCLGVVALWVGGYIWDKMGYYSLETEYASERNTYFEKHMKGKNIAPQLVK